MHDDWSELSAIEARVTAEDRLDLHFEHRDARAVERGSWLLADYLRTVGQLQVRVGDHLVSGEVLTVGKDWVHLTSAIVCLSACEEMTPVGPGRAAGTVLDFRQAVRQMAGRIPREIVLRNGYSRLVTIEWVARDFLHVRADGAAALIPLAQVAVVFGRVEIG